MKDNIIIINGFPNNDHRKLILKKQIELFRITKIPILLISGCEVSSDISELVNYIIVNKENEKLDKKFSHLINHLSFDGTIESPSTYFLKNDDFVITFFTEKPDFIIYKNMILSLKIAQTLGYKKTLYTEDDNLFTNTQFVEKNLDLLNDYDMVSYTTNESVKYNKMFTTFYFSKIEFLLKNFILPLNIEEWYKKENIINYSLYKIFEGVFYDSFKERDTIKNLSIDEINNNIELNSNDRNTDDSFIFNTFFNVFRDQHYNKYLFFFNKFKNAKEIEVYYDNVYSYKRIQQPNTWFMNKIDGIKTVKLIIDDLEKIIDVENIEYNGHIQMLR